MGFNAFAPKVHNLSVFSHRVQRDSNSQGFPPRATCADPESDRAECALKLHSHDKKFALGLL